MDHLRKKGDVDIFPAQEAVWGPPQLVRHLSSVRWLMSKNGIASSLTTVGLNICVSELTVSLTTIGFNTGA